VTGPGWSLGSNPPRPGYFAVGPRWMVTGALRGQGPGMESAAVGIDTLSAPMATSPMTMTERTRPNRSDMVSPYFPLLGSRRRSQGRHRGSYCAESGDGKYLLTERAESLHLCNQTSRVRDVDYAVMQTVKRRRVIVDDSALAGRIGERIRQARHRAGLTQQQVAGERYTKAYISALETAQAKPSMAALNFIAERLALPASYFVSDGASHWDRLAADVLLASGRWPEAVDAYEELLSRSGSALTRADLLRGRAEALCRLDRGEEAIAPAAESVEIFRGHRRRHDVALSTYWLAYAQHQAGNRTEARALLGELLTTLRAGTDEDPDLRMRVLMALSSIASAEGHHRAALGYLEESRVLASDLDDWRRAAFLSMLATSYSEVGDIEGAIRAGTESLALFRAGEARREAAILENNLAMAYMRVGNHTRASELAAHARSRYEAEGDRHSLAHVAETQGQIAMSAGRYVQAIAFGTEAIGHAEASGNRQAMASALLTSARALAANGEPERAILMYDRAVEVLDNLGPAAKLQQALGEWADILAGMGRYEEAFALSRQALQAHSPGASASPSGGSALLQAEAAPAS
jgi:tetratricopeptide (TPR) repeat protein